MNNMFKDMNIFNNIDASDMQDIHGKLVLVDVIAALTDYTHTPFNRAPSPYLPSTMMDELVLESKQGMLNDETIKHYAAHMSGLNNMPGEQARIRGGYTEYNKGLMRLTFRIQNGGITDDYVSVIGYITNNDLEGMVSSNATFVPSFSWRHSTMMDGVDANGYSYMTEQIGRRTDYLLNDGSYEQHVGLSSLRPSDVMSCSADILVANSLEEQMNLEGLSSANVTPVVGAGAINMVGVVCSNRRNMNPTKYAEQLLQGNVRVNERLNYDINGDNGNFVTSEYSSEVNCISDESNRLYQSEYRPSADEFLEYMKELNGNHRSLRGWRIEEIVTMFPNFPDVIENKGCVLLDRNQYPVCDFSEIAQVFGTSSPVETIAQELIFNLFDLMMAEGISNINLDISNCDQPATEHRLSNIVILPSNVLSLSSNDVRTFIKGQNICEHLRNQIFNKLNGYGYIGMTPLRIKMKANMFGSTEVWITNMSSDNQLEVYYCYPTFATTSWSPVFGNSESLRQLSESVYGNIKSYFEKY